MARRKQLVYTEDGEELDMEAPEGDYIQLPEVEVELDYDEDEFEDEVDEFLFPPYKTITTSFPQNRLTIELPVHDRNVAEIVKAGRYRVVDVYITTSNAGEQVVYTYWTVLARDW